jgi:hypothetical protein
MAKYEYDNIPRTQSETRGQGGILRDGIPFGKVYYELVILAHGSHEEHAWRWTLYRHARQADGRDPLPVSGHSGSVKQCSYDVLAWLTWRYEGGAYA